MRTFKWCIAFWFYKFYFQNYGFWLFQPVMAFFIYLYQDLNFGPLLQSGIGHCHQKFSKFYYSGGLLINGFGSLRKQFQLRRKILAEKIFYPRQFKWFELNFWPNPYPFQWADFLEVLPLLLFAFSLQLPILFPIHQNWTHHSELNLLVNSLLLFYGS